MEHEIADDVHAAEGHGLRDGPLHGPAGGRDSKSFHSAPEGAGRVVVRKTGVGVHIADDVHCLGNVSQAHDLRVEADRDIVVIFAGKEEERVALGAEFAVLLRGVDFVDLRLNPGSGHGRRKNENVGPEVRSGSGRQVRLCRAPHSRNTQTSDGEGYSVPSEGSAIDPMEKEPHVWLTH